ncbi:hypothetical protein BHE74_00047890 [Ensete ventricosum]|nr:hypothetical protein GW17_00015622 [Ensete ventricosum]RWW46199.1 hypothetical protein BHE74_00047890 [Ensete ventricosum]RZS06789.1 hypothetical protein BHM03_00037503 [Ensete ventricosum]
MALICRRDHPLVAPSHYPLLPRPATTFDDPHMPLLTTPSSIPNRCPLLPLPVVAFDPPHLLLVTPSHALLCRTPHPPSTTHSVAHLPLPRPHATSLCHHQRCSHHQCLPPLSLPSLVRSSETMLLPLLCHHHHLLAHTTSLSDQWTTPSAIPVAVAISRTNRHYCGHHHCPLPHPSSTSTVAIFLLRQPH